MATSQSQPSANVYGSKDVDATEELQFQKFTEDSESKDGADTHFTSFPIPSPESLDEEADLLTGETKGPPSFWTWEYYQGLFDVDTNQVLNRIMWSMIPRPGYMQRCIKSRPDLYGPFWLCATLVFTIAISGNIADYLRSEGKKKDIWRYDFHKVSFAATAIYTYAWFVPLAIWGLLWYRSSRSSYSLMQIICVYGYSLSIYIPISILWLINITWLQWSFVLIGSLCSGIVLLFTFLPAVKNDENKKAGYLILVVIFVLHIALAVGFMTYFFHGTTHKSDLNTIAVPTTVSSMKVVQGAKSPSKNDMKTAQTIQAGQNLVNAQKMVQSLNKTKDFKKDVENVSSKVKLNPPVSPTVRIATKTSKVSSNAENNNGKVLSSDGETGSKPVPNITNSQNSNIPHEKPSNINVPGESKTDNNEAVKATPKEQPATATN